MKIRSVLLLASLAIVSVPVEAASPFTLSGSPNGTGTITVDDDMDVYLNGVQIYTDGTAGAGYRPPISISAAPGDTLRFVVRDTFGACSSLSTIYLINQTGQNTIVDPGFNLGCGRPSGDQGVVHDLTVTVPDLSLKAGDIIAADGFFLFAINPTTGARTALSTFSNAAQGPTGSANRVATGPGGLIYVVGGANLLYKVSSNGTRVVVSDPANASQGLPFHSPDTPAVDTDGSILVTDRGIGGGGNDGGVWRVNPTTGVRTKILTTVGLPEGIAFDSTNVFLLGDSQAGTDCHTFGPCGSLSLLNGLSGVRTTLSDFGNPSEGPLGEDGGYAVAKDIDGTFLVTDPFAPPCPSGSSPCGVLFRWDPDTYQRTSVTNFADATQGSINDFRPLGVAVAENGTIFVSSCAGTQGRFAICTVDRVTGVRTVLSDFGNAAQGTLGSTGFSLAIMQAAPAGNVAPVANAQPVITDEDTSVAITLTASDADADPLTYSVVTPPVNGALSGAAPNLTYTPHANYSGADSFTFRVNDGAANSNTATVSITVNPFNDAPVAFDSSVDLGREDNVVGIYLPASDADGDPLTYSVVTPPVHGTLSQDVGPWWILTPSTNYFGSDSLTFRVNDGSANSNIATILIYINPVNDAPVAADDFAATETSVPVTIAVLANDTDVDNDPLTVLTGNLGGRTAFRGTLVVNANGTITYTSDKRFVGTDYFIYQIQDSFLAMSQPKRVTIVVTAPNSPPKAVRDSVTTALNTPVVIAVLANDSDVDNDPLAVTAVTQGGAGSVTINGNGTVTYTPNAGARGHDTFTYTISDGRGGTDTATVAVHVR